MPSRPGELRAPPRASAFGAKAPNGVLRADYLLATKGEAPILLLIKA